MSLDPYSACPCGSGKKLKFCCFDIATEIDKIARMLEGNQRAACLKHIEAVDRKYPNRASLLGLSVLLQFELGDLDAVRATLGRFLKAHPNNPVALAQQAILLAETEGGAAAIGSLQCALEQLEGDVPVQVYDALGVVGEALILEQEFPSAVAHLMLQAGMPGDNQQRSVALLFELQSNPRIPLLLKDVPPLAECPPRVAWKKEFDRALEEIRRGAWRRAGERLEGLVKTSRDAPQVWKNLALVRTWLIDKDGAIHAWRMYASLDVPLDEAIESEGRALLIDPEGQVDQIDEVQLTYAVPALEALEVQLASDPRVCRLRQDATASLGEDDVPPPRASYVLLDQPLRRSVKELSLENVPQLVAVLNLFAGDTDRPARLEFVAYRDQRFHSARATLSEIGNDALGDVIEEHLIARRLLVHYLARFQPVFPPGTTEQVRRDLARQQRHDFCFAKWPHLPHKALGGRTPAEASKDARLHIRTLASLMLLEMSLDRAMDGTADELRRQLGLPAAEPIDPAGEALGHVPLVRLHRLRLETLTDDELVAQFRRASAFMAVDAARRFAQGIVKRDTVRDPSHLEMAYALLADTEPRSEERLALVAKGRQASRSLRTSSAPWDLRELSTLLERNAWDSAQQVLEHLEANHRREPGVEEQLVRILTTFGIDRYRLQAAASRTRIAVPAGAAAEPGRIWTPDEERGRPSGEGPGIWLPGQE
jgi:tetratricopeptide (TPR) repeat protein